MTGSRILLLLAFVGATLSGVACQRSRVPGADTDGLAAPEPVPSLQSPEVDNRAPTDDAAKTPEVPDPCEPLPRAGDPCPAGAGYCVESWGEPGGYSSALWCRGGRWEREQEANLP